MPAWMWVVAVLWTILPLVAIEGAHHRSDGLKVPRLLHADADVMQAVARGPATRGGFISDSFQRGAMQALFLGIVAYSVAPIFRESLMASVDHALVAASRFQTMMRKPQRITITLPWALYQALVQESGRQGRSMSNLASFLLERDCRFTAREEG